MVLLEKEVNALHFGKLLKNGKSLILAYDHGIEHGPRDFNLRNIDPDYVFGLAKHFTGIAVQRGIAEKYYKDYREIPLVVKLNGKTEIPKTEPYSAQLCSVSRAIKLGASAVGYTIYLGSSREAEMFREFSKIVDEAHSVGIPVVAWMYPRGQFVQQPDSTETIAYGARVALELGADFVKLKYNGDIEGFKWVVEAAGKTKVLAVGGPKDEGFLHRAEEVMKAGASGLVVGRNIWQSSDAEKVSKDLNRIVFSH